MHIPAILLPGVMGSRFKIPGQNKHWDPDSEGWMLWDWYFAWYDNVRLALHHTENIVLYDDLERGWSGVAHDYYGDLLKGLEDSRIPGGHHPIPPPTVYAVGYDWRQGIETIGDFVANRIEEIRTTAGVEQVDVIAHSMGSLAIRAAFLKNPNLLQHNRIRKLVFVCPPAVGAVILYRRFFTGMIKGPDGGFWDEFFRNILGDKPYKFLTIISGTPGPVQLLPTKHYPDRTGRPWYPGSYVPGMYADTHCPPGLEIPNADLEEDLSEVARKDLKKRIGEQIYYEAFMGEPKNTEHPNSYLIYGNVDKTEIEFNREDPEEVITANAGDQTVADVSALASAVPAGNRIPYSKLEHGEACNDERVVKKIISLLNT